MRHVRYISFVKLRTAKSYRVLENVLTCWHSKILSKQFNSGVSNSFQFRGHVKHI